MSNKIYDVLKYIAQVILPAVATLYLTLSGIWGLPFGDQVSATVMAIDTFLGCALHIASVNYNNKEE